MALTADFDPAPQDIPYSMRLFERIQISAMMIGWANATFTYRTMLHGKISPAVFIAALTTGTVVVAILVFQISRRRNDFCRWALIVLSAMATAPWFALLRRSGMVDFSSTLALIQGGLQVLSLSLLMRPSARNWFASGREY